MQYRAVIASAIAVGIVPVQANMLQVKERATTTAILQPLHLQQERLPSLYHPRTMQELPDHLHRHDTQASREDDRLDPEEVSEYKD